MCECKKKVLELVRGFYAETYDDVRSNGGQGSPLGTLSELIRLLERELPDDKKEE